MAKRLLPFALLLSATLNAQTVSVTARRVLDLESGKLLENTVVRIENGVITSVGPRAAGEAVTYDLGDATLLPGLIDCHTHLVGGEEETPYERVPETTATT